ncbi:MAG: type I glyceraldehyde-3-phosphate dehydrogenase [Tissierellia bacterium]|nr:type I glyceraldehyde-3-phosphate dehydrogenase [Tissierellia bacterium]
MSIKVGVNGFGRIGRNVIRGMFLRDDLDYELVQLNASGDWKMLAHLFKYDSIYGEFPGTVEVVEEGLEINGKLVKISDNRNPEEIPWKENGVEIVIDSTGAFNSKAGGEKHIKAGAKKVILTAPAGDADLTVVLGVNDDVYDPSKHHVISNASCTTNCLAPVAKVIHEAFGIERGLMTTVHAYTNDQKILDNKHKSDFRRARAAAENIIPTSTGAAKAVGLVLPELNGKLTGMALRVPVAKGSIVDATFEVKEDVTAEQVNEAIKKAAEGPLKGILAYTDLPIVSTDIVGKPESSIFDSEFTMVKDRLVKVLSWYDNEWGYSQRVVDLANLVAQKL